MIDATRAASMAASKPPAANAATAVASNGVPSADESIAQTGKRKRSISREAALEEPGSAAAETNENGTADETAAPAVAAVSLRKLILTELQGRGGRRKATKLRKAVLRAAITAGVSEDKAALDYDNAIAKLLSKGKVSLEPTEKGDYLSI